MPEQLTDEQLDTLFAALRAAAMTDVRPPGIEVARRTVQRRRTAVSASVITIAIVALAGFAFIVRPATPPSDVSEQRPAVGPPLAWSTLKTLSQRAQDDLGDTRTASHSGPDGSVPPLENVVVWQAFPMSIRLGDDGFSTSGAITHASFPAPPGEYKLDMRCAGTGTVQVVILSIDEVIGSGDVACSADPGRAQLWVGQQQAGTLKVRAMADETARERSGFAYRVQQLASPSTDSAKNAYQAVSALRDRAGPGRFIYQGTTEVAEHNDILSNVAAGKSTIQVVCFGPGSIDITVRASVIVGYGGQVSHRTFACHPPVGSAQVTTQRYPLDLTQASNVSVDVQWDAAARSGAGFALTMSG